MTEHEQRMEQIEAFINASKYSATTLGINALGDPKAVFQFREGRKMRQPTWDKVKSFMDKNKLWRTTNE